MNINSYTLAVKYDNSQSGQTREIWRSNHIESSISCSKSLSNQEITVVELLLKVNGSGWQLKHVLVLTNDIANSIILIPTYLSATSLFLLSIKVIIKSKTERVISGIHINYQALSLKLIVLSVQVLLELKSLELSTWIILVVQQWLSVLEERGWLRIAGNQKQLVSSHKTPLISIEVLVSIDFREIHFLKGCFIIWLVVLASDTS